MSGNFLLFLSWQVTLMQRFNNFECHNKNDYYYETTSDFESIYYFDYPHYDNLLLQERRAI